MKSATGINQFIFERYKGKPQMGGWKKLIPDRLPEPSRDYCTQVYLGTPHA